MNCTSCGHPLNEHEIVDHDQDFYDGRVFCVYDNCDCELQDEDESFDKDAYKEREVN